MSIDPKTVGIVSPFNSRTGLAAVVQRVIGDSDVLASTVVRVGDVVTGYLLTVERVVRLVQRPNKDVGGFDADAEVRSLDMLESIVVTTNGAAAFAHAAGETGGSPFDALSGTVLELRWLDEASWQIGGPEWAAYEREEDAHPNSSMDFIWSVVSSSPSVVTAAVRITAG